MAAREFTILTFNVENLFDLDGVALFDDYSMDPGEDGAIPYSAELFKKKLDFTAETLAAVNDGEGPEIVLFQELERDRTPESTISDPEAFLAEFEGFSLDVMLANAANEKVRGLPAYAFLLKALAERNMDYPFVAVTGDPALLEESPAHVNAIFSRFPIREAAFYPTTEAREVQVVTVDVEGHPLTLINNHWKSGASNPNMESFRIDNAQTVREILDRLLEDDPRADVIVGGDLNSYYDQDRLFPEMKTTAINSVLGSQGDEQSVAEGEEDLYNLWFELPIESRYTETWRDRKGTLMHMILTPGLYDDRGIRYVDNSFSVLLLPGFNIDEWGRPINFRFEGGGRGGSDHLPILARFETVEGDGSQILELVEPGMESDQPGELLFVNYDLSRPGAPAVQPMKDLLSLPKQDWAFHLGELYEVKGRWVSANPPTIRTKGTELEVYAVNDEVWVQLGPIRPGRSARFLAELGSWRSNYQWVIRDPSWVVGRRGLEPRTN